MKRRIDSSNDSQRARAGIVISATLPGPAAQTMQVRSRTLKQAGLRLAGNGPLALGEPVSVLPADVLRLIASKLIDAPTLVSWSSVNKAHLNGLIIGRERMWVYACLRERCRVRDEEVAEPNETQLLSQFLDAVQQPQGVYHRLAVQAFSPRIKAAVLLLHFAASFGDADIPADAAMRLSAVGAQELAEALLWLDQISPPEECDIELNADNHDWTACLGLHLREFWNALPRLVQPIADGLLSTVSEPALASLVDTIMRLLLKRPRWHACCMTPHLTALRSLVCLPDGQSEVAMKRLFGLLLVLDRCHSRLILIAQGARFWAHAKVLDAQPLAACLLEYARECARIDLADLHNRLPTEAQSEVARANLQEAIGEGDVLQHSTMACADLLVLVARTGLPPAAAARVTAPLHRLLQDELQLLRTQLGWLNQGQQMQQFKQLLTEVPQQWNKVCASTHALTTASTLEQYFIEPDGVMLVFERRVQGLCSILRNLCHLVNAEKVDPANPAVCDLKRRLQALFALWPTKPGRKTLEAWLSKGSPPEYSRKT